MQVTPAQIKKISVLVSYQRLPEDVVDSLIYQFSGGRSTSRKSLTFNEATELISELSKTDPARRMRNKVFALCHDLGWLYRDMHELNALIIDRFLARHGAVKKPLRYCNPKELVKIVTQLEEVQRRGQAQKIKAELDEILDGLGIAKAKFGKPY